MAREASLGERRGRAARGGKHLPTRVRMPTTVANPKWGVTTAGRTFGIAWFPCVAKCNAENACQVMPRTFCQFVKTSRGPMLSTYGMS